MKVLIVKTSSLGDIIQTFSALDYVRSHPFVSEVHWVVENAFAELVKAHPLIDKVLTIDSKRWRHAPISKDSFKQIYSTRKMLRETFYDVLFDFQGNVKSGLIVANAKAHDKVGFGWKTIPEWPATLFTHQKFNPPCGCNIREDYLSLVQGYFKDDTPFVPKPFLLKLDPLQQQRLTNLFSQVSNEIFPTLVCPSAAWPNKCLSEKSLIEFLHHLDKNPYWFAWGTIAERTQAMRLASYFPRSAVLEKLSIPLLQHVMARSRLVVAMDSLPLHLCGTTQTPSISFFGPSSAQKYRPLGKQHTAIQGDCPYGVRFEKRCPQLRTCATGLCLKNFEVDGIMKAKVLAKPELHTGG